MTHEDLDELIAWLFIIAVELLALAALILFTPALENLLK